MSQSDYGVIDPTTTSGTDLASELSNAKAAYLSTHSGTGRPSYAVNGTIWLNTAGTPWVVNMYDGTNDLPLFNIDATGHVPTVNLSSVDPESTIASASTVDLGSVNTARVAISGTVTITSLGSKANAFKLIRFTGALILTYNAASLITPTGQNIVTQNGDTAIAVSDASGNWRIWAYQSVGFNSDTGKVFEYAGISLPANHLWANGAAVSRTTYSTLMGVLTATSTCTTNSTTTLGTVATDFTTAGLVGAKIEGSGIPTGAYITAVTSNTITISAAATTSVSSTAIRIFPWGNGDGATTFNLPDRTERVAVGRAGMGGAADPARMSSTTLTNRGPTNINGNGGAETHTLTVAESPKGLFTFHDPGHTHPLNSSNGDLPITFGPGSNAFNSGGTAGTTTLTVGAGSTNITMADNAGDGAHNNVQPSVVCNFIIRF